MAGRQASPQKKQINTVFEGAEPCGGVVRRHRLFHSIKLFCLINELFIFEAIVRKVGGWVVGGSSEPIVPHSQLFVGLLPVWNGIMFIVGGQVGGVKDFHRTQKV